MTNKALIKIIGILAIISLATILLNLLSYNEIIDYVYVYSTNIFSLLGLYLLFYNSSIRQTIFWRILNVCIAILLVGAWMKIIHLPTADIVVTIALSSISITYIMRFIKKEKKSHLDILKLFWILSAFIIANLIFLHIVTKDFIIISRTLFCITLLDFCLIEYNIIKLSQKTIDQ